MKVIVFGQGDEQPEFTWLDKAEFDFIVNWKRDIERLDEIFWGIYDKNTNI